MADEDTEIVAGGTPPVVPPAVAPVAARPVVGHGGAEIPPERVSEIRAGERRKFNREHYGTEDEAEVARIKKEREDRLAKAAELETKAEKDRLDKLSETERLKEELRIEREQRAAEKTRLETERDTTRDALETERQDVQLTGIGSKYIAPKFLKVAKVELGAHIETLTKAQLAAFDEKAIGKWFANYVKENPEFAPQAPAVAKTAEEIAAEEAAKKNRPPVVPAKRPLGAPRGTGTRPPVVAAKPATGAGTYKGKTVKQMNRNELDEYYSSLGKRKPY